LRKMQRPQGRAGDRNSLTFDTIVRLLKVCPVSGRYANKDERPPRNDNLDIDERSHKSVV
jgi:hypothetical protein